MIKNSSHFTYSLIPFYPLLLYSCRISPSSRIDSGISQTNDETKVMSRVESRDEKKKNKRIENLLWCFGAGREIDWKIPVELLTIICLSSLSVWLSILIIIIVINS